jgi:hypothetical protein
MTVAAEPTAAPTVVLLAEPGAGRARRLTIALHGLGVAPVAVDDPDSATASDSADDDESDSGPAATALDLGALHEQALDAVSVRADDARPSAWADAAGAAGADTEAAVSAWLGSQLAATPFPLVADRRLHWLLPVWVRACQEIGVRVAVVLAVRRPDRSAEAEATEPARPAVTGAAAWLNQVLHVERATRGLPRVIVTMDEVAEDWVSATARIGEALDLPPIRDAAATTIRSTQQALDRAPATAVEPQEPVALPPRLQEQVETVWQLLTRLAAADGDDSVQAELDAARGAFDAYYQEAEWVALSSARAARARRAAKEAPPAAGTAAPEPPDNGGSRLPWRRRERPDGS